LCYFNCFSFVVLWTHWVGGINEDSPIITVSQIKGLGFWGTAWCSKCWRSLPFESCVPKALFTIKSFQSLYLYLIRLTGKSLESSSFAVQHSLIEKGRSVLSPLFREHSSYYIVPAFSFYLTLILGVFGPFFFHTALIQNTI